MLKAISIIETLVAMVLISIVFGIAATVYTNVLQSSQIPTKVRASMIVHKIIIQTKKGSI